MQYRQHVSNWAWGISCLAEVLLRLCALCMFDRDPSISHGFSIGQHSGGDVDWFDVNQ